MLSLLTFMLISTASLGSAGKTRQIPLEEKSWVRLSYNKIPPNLVSFENQQLKVEVKESAGPIVHQLSTPIKVTSFHVQGNLIGSKKMETSAFDEDSILRFGLVAVGSQKLSGPKKWFAADWVKKLFALAPRGLGLDKIYFFNATDRKELVGQSRVHPQSDLLIENMTTLVKESGKFGMSHQLEKPIETAAIWISVDGDDTGSDFTMSISDIRLNTID